MSYDNVRQNYDKERIHIVDIDTPRCVNTYNSSPCTADHYIIRVTVTNGEFQVDDRIEEDGTGYDFDIKRISRDGNELLLSIDPVNPANTPSTGAETYSNNTRLGAASKDAGAQEFDKCFNTRPTCQDLANYNDEISEDSSDYTFIEFLNTFNGGMRRSSGTWDTNFAVGDVITTTGWSASENDRDYLIVDIDGVFLTVSDINGVTPQAAETGVVITKKNYYTYYHCSPRSPHPQNMNNYFPCVEDVSIAPAAIDPKGGIGARASASISMMNFPNSDRNDIDPYLSDRSYTPFDQSLYWIKWRARHADYENIPVRIRTGYIVDNTFDEVNFETRHYVMSAFSVQSNGASIKLKDPLQNISNKKSLAPTPSTGVIGDVGGIDASVNTINLLPTGVGNSEYPVAGSGTTFYVKVDSEVMLVTNRTNDELTVTRGSYSTTAVSHSEDATVQVCLLYTGLRVDEIQYDLLVNYADVNATYIDSAEWRSECETYLNLPSALPDALITDPTEVKKLVMELCEQYPHKLFWNDKANEIQFVAIKEPPLGTAPLNDDDNIMELTVSDKPDMQLSTIFIFYGQKDPTKKLDEEDNYRVTYARVNTDAIARYDSNNTKIIHSRWITIGSGDAAKLLAALHGRRFGFIPREVTFLLEDKDSDLWLGQQRKINSYLLADARGYKEDIVFEIIKAAESQAYQYTALEYPFDDPLGDDITADTFETVAIQGTQYDYNMLTAFTSLYGAPTASTVAKFIIYAGATVGSTSTGTPAMQTGSWPSGASVTLEIKPTGLLIGKGGNGATGASGTPTAATAGGDALSLGFGITLINGGIIGGGGGGGGHRQQGAFNVAGGGGAGAEPGAGGIGAFTEYPADDGTSTAGGRGGNLSFALGGDGGNLGQAGETVTGTGGAAGAAIALNGNAITYTQYGDIRGTIS